MIKYDFSWGNTPGIREIMANELKKTSISIIPQDLNTFDYPAHEGDANLIIEVRKLLKDLTNHEYKYVLITGGAIHALNAYVYAQKTPSITGLATRNLYFVLYPQIAKIHGLQHSLYSPNFDGFPRTNHIGIVDSPSNPEGRLTGSGSPFRMVWDSVYYSPLYCGIEHNGKLVCPDIKPPHEAIVGSMNKLTGINGLRVGWLATDNYGIYEKAFEYVETDLCGVSGPSQEYSLKILQNVDLQTFYVNGKRLLDNNRTEIERLSYLLGGQPIFPYGMFSLFEVDQKLRSLFLKAGVKFTDGKSIGDCDRESVRINLGKTNRETKEMVDDIIKADTR